MAMLIYCSGMAETICLREEKVPTRMSTTVEMATTPSRTATTKAESSTTVTLSMAANVKAAAGLIPAQTKNILTNGQVAGQTSKSMAALQSRISIVAISEFS